MSILRKTDFAAKTSFPLRARRRQLQASDWSLTSPCDIKKKKKTNEKNLKLKYMFFFISDSRIIIVNMIIIKIFIIIDFKIYKIN